MDHVGESLKQQNDQAGNSLRQKKGRVNWKKEGLEKTFLEASIHKVRQNGQYGNSLTMQAWKNVGETLKKEHGFIADQRQMRNRFDYIKGKLRNVIERAYGVLKKKFPILREMAPYPFPIQRDIVIACFAVHNFIRKWNIQYQLFEECDASTIFAREEQRGGVEEQDTHGVEWGPQGNEYMANLRDQIANQLFSSA